MATLATPRTPAPISNGNGRVDENGVNSSGQPRFLTNGNGLRNGQRGGGLGFEHGNEGTEAESLRQQLDEAKAKAKMLSSAFD